MQAIEPTPERLARRVVGIVVKTLVLPKRIGGGRYLPLPAAATTEFSDVRVVDAVLREGSRQHIEIELRIGARARNRAHIGNERYACRSQQYHELIDRSVGMSNHKEGRIASGHV